MIFRLCGADGAVIDQELDEGVVLGRLHKHVFLQAVGAAVPDVDDDDMPAAGEQSDERGTHPLIFRIGKRLVVHLGVRAADRAEHHMLEVLPRDAGFALQPGHPAADRARIGVRGELGSDVAAVGAAHTVADDR